MNQEELNPIIDLYIQTAHWSMGRQAPETVENNKLRIDTNTGLGICMHWVKAGHILDIRTWIKEMGFVQDEEEIEPGLQFNLYKSDGTIEPIGV